MWKTLIGQLVCGLIGHSWEQFNTNVNGKKLSLCRRCFKARITAGGKISNDRRPEEANPQ